jgi:regulator of sigma D
MNDLAKALFGRLSNDTRRALYFADVDLEDVLDGEIDDDTCSALARLVNDWGDLSC